MLKRIEQVEVRQLITSRSEARLRSKHGGLLAAHPGRAGAFVAKEVKRRMESVPKIRVFASRITAQPGNRVVLFIDQVFAPQSDYPAPPLRSRVSANQVRVLPA